MPTYDPAILYEKTGTDACNRCGRCCNQHCEHFSWVAIKGGAGIKAGETFQAGNAAGFIRANCAIFAMDITTTGACTCTLDQRNKFPYDPWQVPPKCAFQNWRPKQVPLEP